MRHVGRSLLAATAGLLLAAGLAASPAEAAARPTSDASHVHGTGTPMPDMDHEVSPMPGMDHGTDTPMPGMEHNGGADPRPRALVLAGFGGLNGAALITAFVLRRRTRARHR